MGRGSGPAEGVSAGVGPVPDGKFTRLFTGGTFSA